MQYQNDLGVLYRECVQILLLYDSLSFQAIAVFPLFYAVLQGLYDNLLVVIITRYHLWMQGSL
jgi:hypothetical protein